MVDDHKITAAAAKAAQRGAAADQALLSRASQRATTTSTRCSEQAAQPNPKMPADPANVARLDDAQARTAALPRRPADLHRTTTRRCSTRRASRSANEHPEESSRSSPARSCRSTTPTAPCVRSAFGEGYDASQFDPAVDGPARQAGSSFKSITLGRRALSGYSPDDHVNGSSLSWRLGPGTGSDAFYNLSGDCHGGTPTLTERDRDLRQLRVRAHRALARPRQLRPRRRADASSTWPSAMGIDTSRLRPVVVSTTLGTNGVHPLEMAQAYSVIASDGVLHPAKFVSKIVGPTGKVLYQSQRPPAHASSTRRSRCSETADAHRGAAERNRVRV